MHLDWILTFLGEAVPKPPAGDIPILGDVVLALFCRGDPLMGDS